MFLLSLFGVELCSKFFWFGPRFDARGCQRNLQSPKRRNGKKQLHPKSGKTKLKNEGDIYGQTDSCKSNRVTDENGKLPLEKKNEIKILINKAGYTTLPKLGEQVVCTRLKKERNCEKQGRIHGYPSRVGRSSEAKDRKKETTKKLKCDGRTDR